MKKLTLGFVALLVWSSGCAMEAAPETTGPANEEALTSAPSAPDPTTSSDGDGTITPPRMDVVLHAPVRPQEGTEKPTPPQPMAIPVQVTPAK